MISQLAFAILFCIGSSLAEDGASLEKLKAESGATFDQNTEAPGNPIPAPARSASTTAALTTGSESRSNPKKTRPTPNRNMMAQRTLGQEIGSGIGALLGAIAFLGSAFVGAPHAYDAAVKSGFPVPVAWAVLIAVILAAFWIVRARLPERLLGAVGRAIGESLGRRKDEQELKAYLSEKRNEWVDELSKKVEKEKSSVEAEDETSAEERFRL